MVLVSRGSSDEELPPGWKEHVKVTNGRKIKFYTHETTGLRLYSKKRVWSLDHMALEGTLRPLSEQDQKSIASQNEDETMACQGNLHSLSEQNQKRITTRSQDKVQAFQGTLQSSSEQDQKSIASQNEDETMACQGNLHSLSEQNQKRITTRSQDKVQAFQGTLQSSSEQMISTPKSKVDPVVVETDASLDWLPLGWIVESKVRKVGSSAGSTYKIYVDPSTGHKFNSKPKVMKYLECVNGKHMPEKRSVKQKVSVDKSYKQEAPHIPIASCVNDDSEAGKMSLEVSVDQSSKQEATHIVPVEEKTATCVKDDSQTGKMSSVVSRSMGLDELPPGWVKELRARKGDPNKKDPYYIDPDSGYEFRSKKDVLRYMETGDMSKCAMKPQPRRHVEKSEHSIPTPTRSACKRLDLNAVDDHRTVASSASATLLNWKQLEAEKSKETKIGFTFAEPQLEFGYIDDKKLHSEEGSETNRKGATSRTRTRTRSQLLLEQKLQEELLEAKPQIELKKTLKRKPLSTPARSSKRLSRVEPEVLPVSSERAIRAAVNKAIHGQAHVSSIMENGFPHQLGTTNQPEGLLADPPITCKVTSPSPTVENGFPHQLGTSTHHPTKFFKDPSVSCEIASPSKEDEVQERPEQEAREVQKALEIPKLGVQKVDKVPEIPKQADGKVEVQEKPEQAAEQVHDAQERREVENSWYPFGDSLADPCYEFAFKTLTGEIPFEDTLAFQSIFGQPAEASSTQSVVSMGLPPIGTPALFQNDIPFQLDSVHNVAPTEKLSNNSAPQPANLDRASFTGFNRQQPSLETVKDRETRVSS